MAAGAPELVTEAPRAVESSLTASLMGEEALEEADAKAEEAAAKPEEVLEAVPRVETPPPTASRQRLAKSGGAFVSLG